MKRMIAAVLVVFLQCMPYTECYDSFTGTCQPIGTRYWKNLYCEDVCHSQGGAAYWQEVCYY